MSDREKILEMRGITKRFGPLVANDAISFDVRAGEIHALLGENGAGKTTLMNVLYGLYEPQEGEILVKGRRIPMGSPQEAIKAGIGMVHQHFMLIPVLTVAQNVLIGLTPSRGPFINLPNAEAKIDELATKHGLKIDPRAKVWQLSVGSQQRVEIIKTLYKIGSSFDVASFPEFMLVYENSGGGLVQHCFVLSAAIRRSTNPVRLFFRSREASL